MKSNISKPNSQLIVASEHLTGHHIIRQTKHFSSNVFTNVVMFTVRFFIDGSYLDIFSISIGRKVLKEDTTLLFGTFCSTL